MATEAIIFDLDDTLVVEVASADAAFLAACTLAHEKHGIEPNELHRTVRKKASELWHGSPTHPYCRAIGISSWEGLWARFIGDGPDLEALRVWAPTYRHESWYRALAEYGVTDHMFADELAETFQRERRARHVVYPDVEPVLKKLRATYRLALLSNGAPDLQREKIRGSKLRPYFDTILISGEVGVRKPDPAIFAMTLDGLGVGPDDALVVGNSLTSDIAGAKNAGITAVWLNRDDVENATDIEPDFEISTLDELVPRCIGRRSARY